MSDLIAPIRTPAPKSIETPAIEELAVVEQAPEPTPEPVVEPEVVPEPVVEAVVDPVAADPVVDTRIFNIQKTVFLGTDADPLTATRGGAGFPLPAVQATC